MPSELPFGIIGCGKVALQTWQAIAAAPNASVAMLMDPRPKRLANLTEVFGAPSAARLHPGNWR